MLKKLKGVVKHPCDEKSEALCMPYVLKPKIMKKKASSYADRIIKP